MSSIFLLLSFLPAAFALQAHHDYESEHLPGCPAPRHEGQKLMFIHIPKNAGTTIEDIGKEANVSWGMWQDYHDCSFAQRRCSPAWHVPPRDIRGKNNYVEKKSFCIVQHPLTKAVSQYKYMAAQYKEFPHYADPCGEIVAAYGCSAEGLNMCLLKMLDKYDPNKYMCHMRPQADYIWDEKGKRTCHHVLRLEDFPQSFNDLMEKYHYDIRLKINEGSNRDSCKLGAADLNATIQEQFADLYSEDYRRLHYDKSLFSDLLLTREFKSLTA